MRELPSGTVTFLFTDIEGSTRLLHELGDGYAEVLAEHRRVLREAFTRHGGVEVDTQGDAFFVAFARASEALAAAREGQAALEGPIRVRMGLHTGEPLVTDEGYVGIDVHRAARIAAVGHGGQVLVSQPTRELCGADGLRDLGEHRLKDLTAPERIYQLGHGEFPPLKSLNATNLPVAANPLVGRDHELAELQALLRGTTRLVTVTGAGGIGKTRLALQVAADLVEDFSGGVFFAALAGVQQPEHVATTIATSVGVHDLSELASRPMLVVADNFEHLLDAAPEMSRLLAEAPNAKVLTTSRAPLRIAGEHEYPVEPLAEPDALTLLTERARSVRPDFTPDTAAREICRRVDGLPLALELAASRLRSLGAATLLERLDRRLPVLTDGRRDAPDRQRTLRATVEWSYDLLSPGLQAVFARLAVFSGTFSLESAETVAEATLDDTAALVEWSLLKPLEEERFLMLETIREYANDRLEQSDEAARVRERHARYFVDRAASISAYMPGPADVLWLDRERDNLYRALAYFDETADHTALALLAGTMGYFWYSHGLVDEGLSWLARVWSRTPSLAPDIRARVLAAFTNLTRRRNDLHEALRWARLELEAAEESGSHESVAFAYTDVGNVLEELGDLDGAIEALERAVATYEAAGDELGAARARYIISEALIFGREDARAIEVLEPLVPTLMAASAADTAAAACVTLGHALRVAGRAAEAEAQLWLGIDSARAATSPDLVADALIELASIESSRGRFDRVARLLGAATASRTETHLHLRPQIAELESEVRSTLATRLSPPTLVAELDRGAALELDDLIEAYAPRDRS